MALKLALYLLVLVFPVAVAVLDLLKLVARLVERGEGFGTPFHGARLATAGALLD
jgi:hypothetical protein